MGDYADDVRCAKRLDGTLDESADELPSTAVARVAKARGCIGPFPCGRAAGAHGCDLECVCETALRRAMMVSAGSPEVLRWTDEEAERAADILFAGLTVMPEFAAPLNQPGPLEPDDRKEPA